MGFFSDLFSNESPEIKRIKEMKLDEKLFADIQSYIILKKDTKYVTVEEKERKQAKIQRAAEEKRRAEEAEKKRLEEIERKKKEEEKQKATETLESDDSGMRFSLYIPEEPEEEPVVRFPLAEPPSEPKHSIEKIQQYSLGDDAKKKKESSDIKYSLPVSDLPKLYPEDQISKDADDLFNLIYGGGTTDRSAKGTTATSLLNARTKSFLDQLTMYVNRSGLTNPEIYKRANLSKAAFSAIFNKKESLPKKSTIVALAIALSLSLKETETLLMKAGYSFSNAVISDLVAVYCINHKKYNIDEINRILYELNCPLLGSKM